jgi:hypothetical protein
MPFSLFGSTDHIALMYFGALLIGEDVGVVRQRALRGEVSVRAFVAAWMGN